jgi:hypothetical protein
MVERQCLPSQGDQVILLLVALAVVSETARPRGMSGSTIETLPWLELVSSLGLVGVGTEDKKEKNARQSDCFRLLEAIKRTPLGATAASSSRGMTSVEMVGIRPWATHEGSPVEVMILPSGAIKFAVVCLSPVKDCSRRHASAWALQTKFAHGRESRTTARSKSMEATASFVLPPIALSLCYRGAATLKNSPR